MNSGRVQNIKSTYRNQIYFYTVAMNNPKMKLIPFTKASKICIKKFNRSIRFVL